MQLAVRRKAGHRLTGRRTVVPALLARGPRLPDPGQVTGTVAELNHHFLPGSGFSEKTY